MKKIIVSIFTVCITLLGTITLVDASEYIRSIKEGDTLEVTMNIINEQDIEGVSYIEGELEYNEEVFSTPTALNITVSDNITDIQIINNKIIVKYFPTDTEEFITVSFEVKDDVKQGQEDITINNLSLYNDSQSITLDDVEYKVDVIENQTSQELEQEQVEVEKDLSINHISSNINTLYIAIALIVLGIVILVVAIKMSNRKSKLLSIVLIIIGIILLLFTIFKGQNYDVNNDGKVDKTDVEEVKQHILALEEEVIVPNSSTDDTTSTNTTSQGNYDVNGDGEVDFEDLGELEEEVEKNELENFTTQIVIDDYYYNKDEQVSFDIVLNNNANYHMTKLIINGEAAEFKYDEYSKSYNVQIEGYKEAGIIDLTIDEITLANGSVFKNQGTISIEILKDEVSIDAFGVTYNKEDKSADISFNIINNDLVALPTANANVVIDSTSVHSSTFTNGLNNINVPVNYNTIYTVSMSLEYNIDSDTLEQVENNQRIATYSYIFRVLEDGTVEISTPEIGFDQINEIKLLNTSIVDTTFTQIDKVAKNDTFYIMYDFELVGSERPTHVLINDTYYPLHEKDNSEVIQPENNSIKKTYYVEMSLDTSGDQVLTSSNIKTTFGIERTIEATNTVQVIKEKPTLTIGETTINTSQMQANISVTDNDGALQSMKYIVYNKDNIAVYEATININDTVISIPVDEYTSGTYTFKILGTYSLETGQTIEEELASDNFEVITTSNITSFTINKSHIEKSDTIIATIALDTNSMDDVTSFVINNTIVDANKVIDGLYTVELDINSSTSGLRDIVLSKVSFPSSVDVVVNQATQVEVLKSPLSISEVTIGENTLDRQVTLEYTIIDNDNSLVNSELVVRDSLDNATHRIAVIPGLNTHAIDVDVNEVYSVTIDATWKKDIAGTMSEEINLYTHDIGITEDYDFTFSNVHTIDNEIYFDKNEEFKLLFNSTNATVYIPTHLTVNDVEYAVSKESENLYSITLTTPDTNGVQDYTITSLKLENGHEEELDNTYQIDVLKDVPVASDFRYEILDNDDVRVYIDILNNLAITNYEIVINDGTSDVYTNNAVSKDTAYIDFTPSISDTYNVQIRAQYDLDSNILSSDENAYNEVLVDETLEVIGEFVEIKDIKELILYKATGDTSTIITSLNINDLNNTDYFVQITDEFNNTRYADVKGHTIKDNNLYLELDIEDSITLDGTRKSGTSVQYGMIIDNIVVKQTFEMFVDELIANPNGTIEIKNNLDASKYQTELTYYVNNFTGTIEGNGYTISNTTVPLFNELNNATLNDIVIENANVKNSSIISVVAQGTTSYSNIHIYDSTITSGTNTGAFIGETKASSNVTITNSSTNNTTIKGAKWTGGLVGKQYGTLTITNSYVQGSVTTSADATGGVLGEAYGNIIFDKIYADITLSTNGTFGRGGIVGYGGGGSKTIKNTISLVTGVDAQDGHKLTGYGSYALENVYTLTDSTLVNQTNANITNISRSDINKEFIQDNLNFDPTIWDIEGISDVGNMPSLIGAKSNDSDIKPDNVEIPNYDHVLTLDSYSPSKDIAYHNMNVMIPHLDVETQIRFGNLIADDHILNTVKINTIYPIDNDGNLVIGLNRDNQDSIVKIRIIMENNEIIEYDVTFEKILDSVTVYQVPDLGIKYNYSKLVFNNHNDAYTEILNMANELSYDQISELTSDEEDRLYVDYYNDYFKAKMPSEVLNILETMPEYTFTNDSQNIINKVKSDLSSDRNLEAILYVSNYFDKNYNFDIGIADDMSDVLFYGSDLHADVDTSASMLVSEVLQTTSDNRATNKTIDFYNNILKPKYSEQEIKTFLETYIYELTLSNDADKWFADQFTGILEERKLQGEGLEDVRYTAWDQINNRNHLLIPILSMPGDTQDDMYIISGPTQITFGSLNRYQPYLDGDVETMRENISHYADMTLAFYENSATYQPNPVKWFNERTNIQYDTRFKFPEGAPTPGTQEFGTSEDPVFKWVNESIKIQAAANGTGAYANGTDVYWVVYSVLWSDFSFSVWTHETAHNQDGRYFYDGNWRRTGTGAEDHADYNIAQNMKEGHLTPNLRYDLDTSSELSVNIYMDRIHGAENIHDFYDDMFDAYYMLDYLTAQAFFKLSPEEQANLVTQVFYMGTDGTLKEEASATTEHTHYQKVTAEEIEAMNLKTMQDLWDNRIVFRNSAIYGNNIYETSTHYDILWYHPYNDERVADGTVFKRTSYEMLGVGGIEGRIAYASGQSENDLEAIQNVTGDSTMTWEKYKMSRWQEVEANLETTNYFDVDEVIDKYVIALKEDAKTGTRTNTNNLRSTLYNAIKHDSEDFDNGSDGFNLVYKQDISTAQQLIDAVNSNEWGSYRLVSNLDFSGIALDEATNAYVTNNFVGIIDGNGYAITGLQGAIFNHTDYGHFKNITFNDIYVDGEDTALLSNSVNNSLIDDIVVSNINVKLPLFASKQGNNVELTPTSYEVTNFEIHTMEDLLEIETSTDPLAKKSSYILMDNIDASSISGNSAIISGEFSGTINGNDKTITGLPKPIFENLTGTVTNLNISSSTVNAYQTEFGLLAQKSIGGTVSNVKLSDITFTELKREKVGSLIGYVENSTITYITLENITISAHNEVGGMIGKMYSSRVKNIEAINVNISLTNFYGGGLFGRVHSTSIENVVVDGSVSTTKTHSGGVAGVLRDNTTLTNVVSNVEVVKPEIDDDRNSNGGIIGAFETNNGSITNALQLSDVQADIPKIISVENDGQNKVNNGYELTNRSGVSSTGEKIISLNSSEITAEFYQNTLGLDDTIWDYSTIDTLGYPTIK